MSMSLKKFVFAIVSILIVVPLLWHFVYAADWTLKYWPDGEIRRAYIHAVLPPQTPDDLERLRAIEWHRRDVADSLIPRATVCVFVALLIGGLVAFLPRRLRKRDDKHIRGSIIDDEKSLRRRIEKEGK
ncbi:MAG: hypothetical protein L6Q60_14170 [Rhodocyclaceae bacterium]|nr:hypothetical protein [Rhodocyclaceae bacterium]